MGPMTMVALNNIDVVMEALVKRQADFAGRPQTYTSLFGSDPRTGLASSTLQHEVLQRLQSEDDLLSAIESPVSNADKSLEEPTPSSSDASEVSTQTPPVSQEDQVAAQLNSIMQNRKRAREAQEEQAQRMVKRSKRVFGPVSVGDNVTVPIPHVDRGRGDPRNIIGVVIECSDNDMFTIAVKGGVLNGKYSRNQFDV
ncbi:uncharacterized protein LOC124111338 [Haliotis rufescens]|uniref:uncharacterized protein LOC124111338 n=1 Tax=Haliotis rufescens TaxID=6454 RepID=UPI00201FAFDB|nr:uncharacterized protein LOC124111338 [Haliotis rufescens]